MRKRVIITTITAIVLFAAVVAAGLNAIFTVTHVRTDFTTYSEEGKEEAHLLREQLDKFVGKSSAFLKLEEVSAVVGQYPFFQIERIEKRYPTTVYLSIAERKETYAVAEEGGYSTYADDGVFLRKSDSAHNRAGGENILLEGFDFQSGAPELTGDYSASLFGAMQSFSAALTELRANVLSVRLVRVTSDPRNDYFRIAMREGVMIDIADPSSSPGEKAARATEIYAGLSDEDRTFGFITVVSGENGELFSDYSRNSSLG